MNIKCHKTLCSITWNQNQEQKSLWTELNELNGGTWPWSPNCTEETFQTDWCPGNWTVLNWCQASLNLEQQDIASQPCQSESGLGEFMNWAEWTELNRMEALGPSAPKLTDWTVQTNWCLGNWTILMPNQFELQTRRPCNFSSPGWTVCLVKDR